MQKVYRETLAAFQSRDEAGELASPEKGFKVQVAQKLRESQEEWLLYRDSFCQALEASFDGGTAAAFNVAECQSDLNHHRTQELKTWFRLWVPTTDPKPNSPTK
jgi:uncharacterized protein YecT (DUF1311 family)